jgi:hypothetical protein
MVEAFVAVAAHTVPSLSSFTVMYLRISLIICCTFTALSVYFTEETENTVTTVISVQSLEATFFSCDACEH